MRWIKKIIGTFLIVSTRSITRQSLGKIAQRAPAVCAKMWCLFFCWSRSESGALWVRGVHSLNEHCVAVCRPISTRFSAIFFIRDCSFRGITQFSFPSLSGAIIFSELRSKIAKSKNRRKVCAHHFFKSLGYLYIDSREIWRKFHCSSLGLRM